MLNVVSFDEAKKIITEKLICSPGYEQVFLTDAVGRTAAEDIVGSEDVPAFTRSTVDGYAVMAADTYGSGESIPALLNIRGEILMGEKADFSIRSGECAVIPTGGMLPEGADSAVMIENTDREGDYLCLVFKAVSPFENVTKRGDDVKAGDVIIPRGTEITSRHVGVLASLGIDRINVIRKPRAAIISTGDEIVDITVSPAPGQIRDVNSYMLYSMLEESGCKAVRCGIIKDSYDELFKAVKSASEEYDAVLISGGSSAGARDTTAQIISELGEVYAHGVAMKPGKPTIIGKIGEVPVIGLPGHPAAAFFVTLTLVKPMLEAMAGISHKDSTVCCPVRGNISSNHGREEFLCVKTEDGFAIPVYGKSGIVSMLTKSDGYIVIGRNDEGIRSGEEVTVHLF